MTADPYVSCPCGSGKKFKWCCQPIHEKIDVAFRQQEAGQHEAAVRTLDEVVKEHPQNPEAWGRKAQLLHANGRRDEAEQALEEAFKLNPNYAFGHLLRGLFRQAEGEEIGAATLFRKATELYAYDAHEQLSFLFEQISNVELKRNHPVAGRYALDRCRKALPESAELADAFEDLFGPGSRLPEVARKDYHLDGGEPNRPVNWKNALSAGRSGKLSESAKAFEELAKAPKADPLASYNVALLKAFLGENRAALEALEQYVERETNEPRAAEAWALAEVLRLGQEMLEVTDYVQYRMIWQFREGTAVVGLLQEWERAGRLAGMRSSEEEGVVTGLVLQESSGLIGATAPIAAPLAGSLLILGNTISVWHVNKAVLDQLAQEIQQKIGAAFGEHRSGTLYANFGDVTLEGMMFPTSNSTGDEVVVKMKEFAQEYFEETWTKRTLKTLNGNTPIDAAGHPVLRRRLLGAILFLEQCFEGNSPRVVRDGKLSEDKLYDFDRLRHKLGLDTAPPPSPAPTIDLTALSAADLAALHHEELTIPQLEQAWRSAVKLDANELARQFVNSVIARPSDPGKPDLFAFYKYLIDQAQAEGDWNTALGYTDAGQQADRERNEGKRQCDYELRRGQLYAKQRDADKAEQVFDQLVARLPNELKFRGTAAEAMLGLRKGAKALKFAEAGLSEARKQNNRDMEAYFMELVGAAKKQGG
ncbi:MAG TPA: tetratricopeptide repeat protein [Gemmataceae bacterium]|jgi:tetratricopeptide (TPR) repeat protein|nr:tetratricopeptide repeat protein [Gemmataceae bacterium]